MLNRNKRRSEITPCQHELCLSHRNPENDGNCSRSLYINAINKDVRAADCWSVEVDSAANLTCFSSTREEPFLSNQMQCAVISGYRSGSVTVLIKRRKGIGEPRLLGSMAPAAPLISPTEETPSADHKVRARPLRQTNTNLKADQRLLQNICRLHSASAKAPVVASTATM